MRLKSAWPLFGVMGLMGWLYVPVLRDLWEIWETNENYSHGFLIPVIAGYMIWTDKEALAGMSVKPSLWGAVLIAASLFLLLVGDALESVVAGSGGLFVKGVSFPLMLAGMALLFLGPHVLKKLAFPLAYLLFMVPLPGGIFKMLTLPLQDYATGVTTSVLKLAGIDTFREGNIIVLPAMTLGVVEACSGIRSLFSLLALACAMAFIFIPKNQWVLRVLMVLSAVPIAIMTNAFRVTATGFMSHFWGSDMAQGFYHDFSGWVVFLMAMAILVIEVVLLSKLFGEMEQETYS